MSKNIVLFSGGRKCGKSFEQMQNLINKYNELQRQLQAEQQAHNALKEKLKETKWIIGRYLLSGKNNCPVCGDLTKEGHLIDCKIYQAIKEGEG